jgi:hypothetical protein
MSSAHPHQDRVLPYTLGLSVFVLPFLLVASVLLYILPTRTDQLFAWTIVPPLTAMLLASAYVGGIWFFVQVVRQRRWHRVKHGFPAVVLFSTLLGVATFLHLDRFHFGHISFLTWVALYITTPFLSLAALLANRRADDGTPEQRDVPVPPALRMLVAIVGVAALACGLVLFLVPSVGVDLWAWKLTPLTARVTGAVLTLPGMVNLGLLFDRRWSAFRWVFQAQFVSLVFIAGALVVARSDLLWSRSSAILFVAGIALSFVAYAVFYAYNERAYNERAYNGNVSPGQTYGRSSGTSGNSGP